MDQTLAVYVAASQVDPFCRGHILTPDPSYTNFTHDLENLALGSTKPQSKQFDSSMNHPL